MDNNAQGKGTLDISLEDVKMSEDSSDIIAGKVAAQAIGYADGEEFDPIVFEGSDVSLTGTGGTTDPYAGYDLVFSTDLDISLGDWEVVKGDFEAVKAKLIAGEPVHGIAYFLSDYTQTAIECPVYRLQYDNTNDNIYILLHNFNNDSSPAIVWLNDGRVIWDE